MYFSYQWSRDRPFGGAEAWSLLYGILQWSREGLLGFSKNFLGFNSKFERGRQRLLAAAAKFRATLDFNSYWRWHGSFCLAKGRTTLDADSDGSGQGTLSAHS